MYNFLFISNFQHVIFLEKQIIKFKSLKKTNNPLFKINLNIFLQRSREVFANKSSLNLISLEVDKLPNLVLIQNSTLDYNLGRNIGFYNQMHSVSNRFHWLDKRKRDRFCDEIQEVASAASLTSANFNSLKVYTETK